jgi:DNA recombination protein RmuC
MWVEVGLGVLNVILSLCLFGWLVRLSRFLGAQSSTGVSLESLSATIVQNASAARDFFRQALADESVRGRADLAQSSRQLREEIAASVRSGHDLMASQISKMSEGQMRQLELMSKQWMVAAETMDQRMRDLQSTVDARLLHIEKQSGERLEMMRKTVEEKLEGTLERRLGDSFKLVGERLEQVQRGLGEMQSLANGVGDLKRVLTNVKTRGTWGEVQLSMLLEQILTPEQYEANAKVGRGSDIVEFAIKLPGRDDDNSVVLLPIDSKFPWESYQRLLDAQDQGLADQALAARRELEQAVRVAAKDIKEKYLNPPKTTDFAVMFLPTEGLYAEVLRIPGIIERMQNEQRITIAGPTTLSALLNSLQMGFRTMAIQKRSGEVWKVLGAVKTEFGKFGDILDGVQKKLGEAAVKIEDASRKSRTIQSKLRQVEELPLPQSTAELPLPVGELSADEV